MGVHVAHQYLVLVATDQVPNVGQLQAAHPGAEGQVHHHHHQRFRAFAKAQQDCAATFRARQRMVFDRPRFQSTEHAIAVLGQPAEVAIELLIPVREGAEVGQVFDLIDVA